MDNILSIKLPAKQRIYTHTIDTFLATVTPSNTNLSLCSRLNTRLIEVKKGEFTGRHDTMNFYFGRAALRPVVLTLALLAIVPAQGQDAAVKQAQDALGSPFVGDHQGPPESAGNQLLTALSSS